MITMKNTYEASVVVPAYNEESSIKEVVKRIRNVSSKYEIIIVDDGSADGTAEMAKQENATVIKLGENHGKGFACAAGSKKASCEKIVFIDADLQLKPEEIPKFISALDRCDLAIGVREMKKIPIQRRLANAVARKILGVPVRDALCGFRAVRKHALKKMNLTQRRYEFESEMLLAAARHGMKIEEVPVNVSYDAYKGMTAADSARIVLFILKERSSLGSQRTKSSLKILKNRLRK